MKITRRPVHAGCDVSKESVGDTEVSRESYIRGGGDSYEVFMLMDDTYCVAKFFAKDLDDAENQLFEMYKQYPNFAEGLYVQPFNESDDNFNSDNLLDTANNEVYSDLSIIFKQWDDNYAEFTDYYGEELPFASTQIMSATDDTESASVTDVTKGSYIRGENIYDDISEDELKEYEFVAYEHGYALYRKIVNGKGQWAAQDQDEKHPPFRITYEQALGYEPIDKYDSDVQKLSRELGRMLLPNSTTDITASDDVAEGNVMYITVNSGVNADGFSVDIVDPATDESMFSESYYYGYNASYNRMHADHAHKDVEDAKKYGWDTKYTEKPFVTDIINELCAEYDVSSENIIVQSGKNRFTGGNVDDATVRDFKESYLSASTSVEAASYGGAYDIEDDMFFTRDDIVEWANAVVDQLNDNNNAHYEIGDVYFTDPSKLTLEVYDDDKYLTVTETIDMRRIRKPDDLNKYSLDAVNKLQEQHDNFLDASIDEIESTTITAATDDEPVELPEFSDYIDFALNNIRVVVDTDGSVTLEDEDALNYVDNNLVIDVANYTYSETDEELVDYEEIADNTMTLITPLLPLNPGTYTVNGKVHLVYNVSGIMDYRDYDKDEIDAYTSEYDFFYKEVNWDFSNSEVTDFAYIQD